MIVSTTPVLEGFRVTRYHDIVTGETKRVKEITVGKLSLIGQILKKEEFIGDL